MFWYTLTSSPSLIAELGDGRLAIALDPGQFRSAADEKYKLAHELGHGLTGALYARRTPLDERGRCELRADRWAIERLLPFEALRAAVREGRKTVPELAEFFELPEELVEKAVAYYLDARGLKF